MAMKAFAQSWNEAWLLLGRAFAMTWRLRVQVMLACALPFALMLIFELAMPVPDALLAQDEFSFENLSAAEIARFVLGGIVTMLFSAWIAVNCHRIAILGQPFSLPFAPTREGADQWRLLPIARFAAFTLVFWLGVGLCIGLVALGFTLVSVPLAAVGRAVGHSLWIVIPLWSVFGLLMIWACYVFLVHFLLPNLSMFPDIAIENRSGETKSDKFPAVLTKRLFAALVVLFVPSELFFTVMSDWTLPMKMALGAGEVSLSIVAALLLEYLYWVFFVVVGVFCLSLVYREHVGLDPAPVGEST
jgi:hypothetical protein